MDAKILLKRTIKMPNFTMGELWINGVFFCHTLEDQIRDSNNDGDIDDAGEEKVYGKTAIPRGDYKVVVTRSERFSEMASKKAGKPIDIYLPLLLNVKGFEGIRIHGGNKAEDSLGCILVAYNAYKNEGRIQGSASKDLVAKLEGCTNIEITIV